MASRTPRVPAMGPGRCALLAVVLLFLNAPLVRATTDAPEAFDETPYSGWCEPVALCRASGRCAEFPALGRLLLFLNGTSGEIGPSEDRLQPVTVSPTATEEPSAIRHLVPLPSEGWVRRFAFNDRSRPRPPGEYTILECTEALP